MDTEKYATVFFKVLSEEMISSEVVGTPATGPIYSPDSNINSKDTYEPNSAIVPKSLFKGVNSRKGLVKGKRIPRKKYKRKIKQA